MCQSERSLCCQDVPSFGNSLTKMSHLSAGDPRTVRSCMGGLFSVCQSDRPLVLHNNYCYVCCLASSYAWASL